MAVIGGFRSDLSMTRRVSTVNNTSRIYENGGNVHFFKILEFPTVRPLLTHIAIKHNFQGLLHKKNLNRLL